MLVSAEDSRSVEPASLAGRYVDAARLLEPLFSSISCTVFRAGKHTFSPDWQLAPVALPHYRFFIGVSAAAEFVVGGAPHRLEPCGVILVPPQVVHQARPAADSSVVAYVIEFEARLHGILDVPAFCGLPVSLMPSATRREKIAVSAHNIVHHLNDLVPGYHLALHTHCIRLLDLLWKETIDARQQQGLWPGPAAGGVRALELWRIRPVFALVEARYAERLTLADLADAVHLHPAYFCTVFKRVAGMPPHDYLARYRVERVRDLLLATDLPLEQIALRTGFYDAAHLIRVFRRLEGVSPGRYRRGQPPPGRAAGAPAAALRAMAEPRPSGAHVGPGI